MVKESVVTVPAFLDPIELSEMKAFLKVEGTDEDSVIEAIISTATKFVEEHTGRSLMTQTRVMKMDYFPCSSTIELMYGPVQSVVITYYDEDATEQTLNSSEYWTELTARIPRVVVKNNWPSTEDERPGAVTITTVCGYTNKTNVPRPIRDAIKMIGAHLFEHREQNSSSNLYDVPFDALTLLNPFVITQDANY